MVADRMDNQHHLKVTPGNPPVFIFVTEDGTISGWNRDVDPLNAILKVPKGTPPSLPVYKGVTLGQMGGANFLYVANFSDGTVDVFDTHFDLVSMLFGWQFSKERPIAYSRHDCR